MRAARASLLAWIGLAAACARPARSLAGRVEHLDLRLADGRSPAAVLDGESELVRRFDVRGPDTAAEDLAPWTLENGAFLAPARGGGATARALDYRPAEGVIHAALVFPEPLDAGRVNSIEVDVAVFESGNATLTWSTAREIPGVPAGAMRVDALTHQGGKETLTFALAGHPGWRGAIRELRLYPAWKGAQSYTLHALRFLFDGFAPGPQPLCEEGVDSGDGGLIGFAGDERRTWPTDEAVPLFARVQPRPGARLAVDVGLAGDLHDGSRRAQFAVDARRAGREEPFRELGRREVVAYRYPERAAWRDLVVDLDRWAGEELELRFRAWFDSGDDPLDGEAGERGAEGGEPRRARLWWGSPLVLPARDAPRPPSVVLVTLDTLRADAVGAWGGPPHTPTLDALAASGVRFADCWSASNSTSPSHASILTGLEVPAHGLIDNRSTLAAGVPTLAQAFRAAGYETAAAVSVEHLQAAWSGFGRGFDRYLEVAPGAPVDGALTLRRLARWTDAWGAQGPRPLFLWVHLFDPHTPYGPPRRFLVEHVERLRAAGGTVPAPEADPPTIGRTGYTARGEFLEGVTSADYARFLYDASVAYTDELVRDLLGLLREARVEPEAWLAVTADHGESLGELDVWYGHQLLHPPVVHVPLVLRIPGGPAGLVVQERVSNADLARTFVEALDLPLIDPRGVDLRATFAPLARANRRVWFAQSGLDQVGCRDDDAHYFHNVLEFRQLGPERASPKGADFLFGLDDPRAERNLAEARPELAARYRAALAAWLAAVGRGRTESAALGAAEEARLQELGYGGGEEHQ